MSEYAPLPFRGAFETFRLYVSLPTNDRPILNNLAIIACLRRIGPAIMGRTEQGHLSFRHPYAVDQSGVGPEA